MKISGIVFLFCLMAFAAEAQDQEAPSQPAWKHQLSDFGVKKIFRGKPHLAVLSKSDRTFSTRLREGAANGPNFAGHYAITVWGCGDGCLVVNIIDALTGKIQFPQFNTLGRPISKSGREYQALVFRLDSALLIVDGCPQVESHDPPACGTYYYVMRSGVLKQIDFVADPPADEPPPDES